MLPAAITITGSSGGPGSYTATVLFSDASQAPFVRVNDILEDRLGNQYRITSWAGFPSDFSSGGTFDVDFITTDIAPATFGGFGNALVFTEGQVDVRPAVQSAGQIQSQSLNSGQNSLYDMTALWFDSASAANVQAGDHIMDSAGKIYVITITNGGATSVTAEELTKEGISPSLGDATLFRPTSSVGLFQGTPVSDPARTQARNKDDFNIDAKIVELEGQISSGGAGTAIQETLENSSGAMIPELGVVSGNASGTIETLDPSSEASALAVRGVAVSAIADAGSGIVASGGRLENVTTSFDFGDALFVAKDGTITNVKPDIGVSSFVAGDWIIYIGHVARNQTTPANKDFFLKPEVVGQL